jgi:hypothetical protein
MERRKYLFWNKKCDHELMEIGRYFKEYISEYYNGTDGILGYIEYRCSKCDQIITKKVYEKYFYCHKSSNYMYDKRYSIDYLMHDGFIEETKYKIDKLKDIK